jgi:hypothetical protein
MADNQLIRNPGSKFTVITIGAINYKGVVLNWVRHMKRLNISNYIVICVDQLIFEELDPLHALLMAPTFRLNLSSPRRWKYKRDKVSRPSLTFSKTKESPAPITTPIGPERTNLPNRRLRATPLEQPASTETRGYRIRNSKSDNASLVGRDRVRKSLSELKVRQNHRGFEKRIKNIGLGRAFNVLMITKHSVLYTLLSAGHTVVWSDVDCVWLRPCAFDSLDALARPVFRDYYSHYLQERGIRQRNHHINHNNYSVSALRERIAVVQRMATPSRTGAHTDYIDFASQQGLHPHEMSHIIGTAICTGLFAVNPTAASLLVIRSVRDAIIGLLISATDGMGDQKLMNTKLIGLAGIENGSYTLSASSASAKNEATVGRIEYGPSSLTGRPQDELFQMKVLLTSDPFARTRDEDAATERIPFTVGFLPYNLFPRGDAASSASSDLQQSHERDPGQEQGRPPTKQSSTWSFSFKNVAESIFLKARVTMNPSSLAELENPPSKIVNVQAVIEATKQRNADEWKALSSSACIWHMYAQKTGESKVESMLRDGVLLDSVQEDDDDEHTDMFTRVVEDEITIKLRQKLHQIH